VILNLSLSDLLNVLGFEEGEEIDEEGNKSTYHLILEYIWKKVRKNNTYFTYPEFKKLDVPDEELNSYLSRLHKKGIFHHSYRVDCPECDTPYNEIDEDPLSMWGVVYKCPLCKSMNQILLEDILCYYKFDSKFKEVFHNFFFLQNYHQMGIKNQILLL